MFIINLILSIIPAIIILIWIYNKDVNKPEPKGIIILTFFIGMVSVIPAILIGMLALKFEAIQNTFWMRTLVTSFITAGLIEEFSKFLVLRVTVYNNKNFDEIMDGIVYSVIISLGFATVENIMYSIDSIGTALIRGFTAVPGHAIFSGIMGYFIGLAKFSKNSGFLFFTGVLVATFFHGLYDFFLFGSQETGGKFAYMQYLIFPLLIIMFFILRSLIRKAIEEDIRKGYSKNNKTIDSVFPQR